VQVYAFDDDLGEVTADGQPVVPFVATDTTGGYLSVTCADDALVCGQAVAHEPPGIVFAWDVRETRYAVDGLRATGERRRRSRTTSSTSSWAGGSPT
jgi:hypothetical protein